MKEESLPIAIDVRYFTNECPEPPEQVWLVCHGYGQLAKYFIRHFDGLGQHKIKVIAAEGLHRFYLAGTEGRVGASWMTKEDRLRDIENYKALLRGIYEKEIRPHSSASVTLLGFSQGASTISRLAMESDIDFDRLIIWAGVFPPDVPLSLGRQRLQGKELYFVYGDQDEYVTEAKAEEIKSLLDQTDLSYHVEKFHGGHNMNREVLLKLASPSSQ